MSITYEQIRAVRVKIAKSELIKEASATHRGKRVFLSHSHLDSSLLPHIIQLFDNRGAPVYLDKDDSALPRVTSSTTASVLRKRIMACPRFVLATSENIRSSRWTPWELGFADGKKGRKYIALMPLVPSKEDIPSVEQEYLDLYPRIEKYQPPGEFEQWVVMDPWDDKYWLLKDWLMDEMF